MNCLNRYTINQIYDSLRQHIADASEAQRRMLAPAMSIKAC